MVGYLFIVFIQDGAPVWSPTLAPISVQIPVGTFYTFSLIQGMATNQNYTISYSYQSITPSAGCANFL